MKWRKINPLHPEGAPSSPSRLPVRLLWMASIWAASVVVMLAIAGVVRLFIKP